MLDINRACCLRSRSLWILSIWPEWILARLETTIWAYLLQQCPAYDPELAGIGGATRKTDPGSVKLSPSMVETLLNLCHEHIPGRDALSLRETVRILILWLWLESLSFLVTLLFPINVTIPTIEHDLIQRWKVDGKDELSLYEKVTVKLCYAMEIVNLFL